MDLMKVMISVVIKDLAPILVIVIVDLINELAKTVHVQIKQSFVMDQKKLVMLIMIQIVLMGLMKVQRFVADQDILLMMVFVTVEKMNGVVKTDHVFLQTISVMVLLRQETLVGVPIVLTDQTKVKISVADLINQLIMVYVYTVEMMNGLVWINLIVYLLATSVMVLMKQGMLLMVLIAKMDLMKVQMFVVDRVIQFIMVIALMIMKYGHVMMVRRFLGTNNVIKIMTVMIGLMKNQKFAVNYQLLLILRSVVVDMMNGHVIMVNVSQIISSVMLIILTVRTGLMKIQTIAVNKDLWLMMNTVVVEMTNELVTMDNAYLLVISVMVLMNQEMLLMVLIVVMGLMKVQVFVVEMVIRFMMIIYAHPHVTMMNFIVSVIMNV